PARGQVDAALGPTKPGAQRLVEGVDVDVGEVAGVGADPGRFRVVGRLGVQVDAAGRLVVAQPDAGAGTEVGGGRLVLGEPEEQAFLRLGAAQRLAECGGE